MHISHDNCLKLLANPTTQNILEALGFEYSDRGLSEYRMARPSLVPQLVAAIIAELQVCPVFPAKFKDRLPDVGVYISKRDEGFVLADIEKPSLWDEYTHATAEGAARAYIWKMLDPYWIDWEMCGKPSPKSVRTSWGTDRV